MDCGLTHNTDASLKSTLKAKFPGEVTLIEDLSFHPIAKSVDAFKYFAIMSELTELDARLNDSLIEDMQYLRDHPLIKKDMDVRGFLYHIDTGNLEEMS